MCKRKKETVCVIRKRLCVSLRVITIEKEKDCQTNRQANRERKTERKEFVCVCERETETVWERERKRERLCVRQKEGETVCMREKDSCGRGRER